MFMIPNFGHKILAKTMPEAAFQIALALLLDDPGPGKSVTWYDADSRRPISDRIREQHVVFADLKTEVTRRHMTAVTCHFITLTDCRDTHLRL